MRILVIGATFVDIKGFPEDIYIPTGRNVGRVEYLHGGVARNVVEDIANVELQPIYLGIVDDTPMGVSSTMLKNVGRSSTLAISSTTFLATPPWTYSTLPALRPVGR